MSRKAPQLHELNDKVKELLEDSSFFSGISVIVEDGEQRNSWEEKLRSQGVVLVVWPLLGGRQRDQSQDRTLLDSQIAVRLKTNPKVNNASGGANLNVIRCISEIISAVCGGERHPGGEHFRLAGEAFDLVTFDEGLWEYQVNFTKEILI